MRNEKNYSPNETSHQISVAKLRLKTCSIYGSFWRLNKILIALMLMISINLNGQVRPSITGINADPSLTVVQEQAQLAKLIHYFLESDNHAFVLKHNPARPIHLHSSFFPWHRYYIGIIEDHLVDSGMDKYVPLPKWNPNTTMPGSFYTGANSVITGISPYTGGPYGNLTSNNLNYPILSWDTTTICSYPTRDLLTGYGGSEPGPLGINKTIHDIGHAQVGGAMSNLGTAAGASIFYLWHGFIDDQWKKWECNCATSAPDKITGVDLYMKDRNHDDAANDTDTKILEGLDMGYEPFNTTQVSWQSEDIWVRNQDDGKYNSGINTATTNYGIRTHQNAIAGQTNYIYVCVRNRSCTTSLGTEKLTVSWAKQSTALGWPSSWDGTGAAPWPCMAGLLMGDYVQNGTAGIYFDIPVIKPGGQAIVKIAWNTVPNPSDYVSCVIDSLHPWNICFLARIVAANDPMHIAEGPNVMANVKNNNNIIMRNGTAPDCYSHQLDVEVGNPYSYGGYFSYNYDAPSYEYDHPITSYANVSVYLGPAVYNKWVAGGYGGYGVQPDTTQPYTVKITAPNASISHLYFNPDEKYIVQTNLGYSETYNDTSYSNFTYNIYQINEYDSSYSGGVCYGICKPECPHTNAGYNTPVPCGGGNVYLNAAPVPGATYNWYNYQTGQYVGTGDSIYSYTTVPTTYQLEITSLNGCKDYSYKKATMITNLQPGYNTQNANRNKNLTWTEEEEYSGQYDVYFDYGQSGNPHFMQYTPPVIATYGTVVGPALIGTLLPNHTYYWYVSEHGYLDTNCIAYQFTTGTSLACDPPVINGVGPATSIECPASPVFPNPTANSNCGTVSFTHSDATVAHCGNTYSVTRTWTATDGQGDTSTASQTINVVDTHPPVIDPLPAPSVVPCHFAPVYDVATATDACGSVSLTYVDIVQHDFCGSHTQIRKWTASDGCNSSTASQSIYIDHTANPFITPAINLTVESDGSGNLAELNSWLQDNGGADLEGECTEGDHIWANDFTSISPLCGTTGSATVTFSAKHPCSNSTLTTATFTIVDTQAPLIAAPINITVCYNGVINLGTAIANDAGGAVLITNDAPTTFPVGTTTVTWTATDACGHTAIAVQLVTRNPQIILEDFSELSIFPNPATTSAEIQFDGFAQGKGILSVYDIIGKQVSKQNISVVTGINNYKLDLSKLAKGAYTVRVTYKGFSRNCKLIVQ